MARTTDMPSLHDAREQSELLASRIAEMLDQVPRNVAAAALTTALAATLVTTYDASQVNAAIKQVCCHLDYRLRALICLAALDSPNTH